MKVDRGREVLLRMIAPDYFAGMIAQEETGGPVLSGPAPSAPSGLAARVEAQKEKAAAAAEVASDDGPDFESPPPDGAQESDQEAEPAHAGLNRTYFALLKEHAPELADSEALRKLWQEQRVGHASCRDWSTEDFELAILLVRRGQVGVRLPEPSRGVPGTAADMRVVGLDPSLTATGVAVDSLIPYVISPPRGDRGATRLAYLDKRIRETVYGADLVVIEGYSYGSRGAAAYQLGELGGVIRLAFHQMDIPVAVVAPPTVKMLATGKGNAKKEAVLAACDPAPRLPGLGQQLLRRALAPPGRPDPLRAPRGRGPAEIPSPGACEDPVAPGDRKMRRENGRGVVERYHAGPMTPRTGFDSRPCHRMLPPGRAAQ